MGVYPRENVELDAYQLKNISQVSFDQWRDEIHVRVSPVDLGSFKTTFLDGYPPLDLMEQK